MGQLGDDLAICVEPGLAQVTLDSLIAMQKLHPTDRFTRDPSAKHSLAARA